MNKNENKIPEDMLPNPVSIDNDVHPDLMGEVFKETQDNETCECVGECTCKKGHNQKDNEEDSPGLNDEDENTCHCDGDCTCNKPKEDTSKTCDCDGDCTCNKPKEEDHHQIDTGKINNPVSMDNDLHVKEEVFSSKGDETMDSTDHEIDFEHLSQVMDHKRKEYETDTSEDEYEDEFDENEKTDKIFLDIQTRHDV